MTTIVRGGLYRIRPGAESKYGARFTAADVARVEYDYKDGDWRVASCTVDGDASEWCGPNGPGRGDDRRGDRIVRTCDLIPLESSTPVSPPRPDGVDLVALMGEF